MFFSCQGLLDIAVNFSDDIVQLLEWADYVIFIPCHYLNNWVLFCSNITQVKLFLAQKQSFAIPFDVFSGSLRIVTIRS